MLLPEGELPCAYAYVTSVGMNKPYVEAQTPTLAQVKPQAQP